MLFIVTETFGTIAIVTNEQGENSILQEVQL